MNMEMEEVDRLTASASLHNGHKTDPVRVDLRDKHTSVQSSSPHCQPTGVVIKTYVEEKRTPSQTINGFHSNQIYVNVETPSRRRPIVTVRSNTNKYVRDLEEVISMETKSPKGTFNLLHGEETLQNGRTLGSYNFRDVADVKMNMQWDKLKCRGG